MMGLFAAVFSEKGRQFAFSLVVGFPSQFQSNRSSAAPFFTSPRPFVPVGALDDPLLGIFCGEKIAEEIRVGWF